MDSKPLVNEQTEAGAKLIEELRKSSLEVAAAFWLNPSEEGKWRLYIASPEIDKYHFDHAYGEALRIVQAMNTPYLDPFQVRMIGVNDPLAQYAIAFDKRFPGQATHFRGDNFGEVAVEEAYLYPCQLVAASS